MLVLLTEKIIPKLNDDESKLYYTIIKADYLRNITEISMDREYIKFSEHTENQYKKALTLAQNLPMHDLLKINLAINYSVFLYEIKNAREEAKAFAKQAFDECMKSIDELNKSKSLETITAIKILKENITLWDIEVEAAESFENEEFFRKKAQEFKVDV